MSTGSRNGNIAVVVFTLIVVSFLSCGPLPVDPTQIPANSSVHLFLNQSNDPVVEYGATCEMGLELRLQQHFKKVVISSECGAFDTSFSPDGTVASDTVFFSPHFDSEGKCAVYVRAEMFDTDIKDRTDTLIFHVLAPKSGIRFSEVPDSVAMNVGETDTLLFVSEVDGGDALVPQYVLNVEPSSGASFFSMSVSRNGDTAMVIANPLSSGRFTVSMSTGISKNGAVYTDTARVTVFVAALTEPGFVRAPSTIITGRADTLIFVLDSGMGGMDAATIKLVHRGSFDSTVFSLVPSGSDSIVIAISSDADPGTVEIGIAIDNGSDCDTSWYPVTMVTEDVAMFNVADTDADAEEGLPLELDITRYLSNPDDSGILLTADLGRIDAATGHWVFTPQWGGTSPVKAIISARRDDLVQTLTLNIAVSASDTIAPRIRLANPQDDGRMVSASALPLECIVSDSQAGVKSVVFKVDGVDFNADKQDGDVYRANISGLRNRTQTEITVVATDRSMRHNSDTLHFSMTYDSTLLDGEVPVITLVNGPKNGDTLSEPALSITFRVMDKSGIDSVWWTLDTIAQQTLELNADSTCTIAYTLTGSGTYKITLHAKDGSSHHNSGSSTLTISYNTSPGVPVLSQPGNGSSNVSCTTTFTWSGGDDSDGDQVYYKVLYRKRADLIFTVGNEIVAKTFSPTVPLVPNTDYVWEVFAYTHTFPDTAVSSSGSFKTAGVAPSFTLQPKSLSGVNEGSAFSLTAAAEGVPAPSYKWYHNGTALTGDMNAVFSIGKAALSDSGEYYVVVNNGVGGSVTSDKVSVKVLAAVRITVEPTSQSVVEGSPVTFSVTATGAGVLQYHWQKGTEPITGATSNEYKIDAASASNDPGSYSCIVSNTFSSDTSGTAVLSVSNGYRVTYNLNHATSGTVPVDNNVYTTGDAARVTDSTAIKKAGEVFSFWCRDSLGSGKVYSKGDTVKISGADVTLYVKWQHADTLLAHWSFDAFSGKTYTDVTGNGFDAVSSCALSPDGGQVGKAQYCTGDSVKLQVSNSATLFNQSRFSIDAYVNIDTVITHDMKVFNFQCLATNVYNGFTLYIGRSSKAPIFSMSNAAGSAWIDAAGTTTLVQGVWYHLQGTYDGDTLRLYVDGALEGKAANTGGFKAPGSDAQLAETKRQDGTYTDFLHGLIDEVKFYNYAIKP